MEKGIKPVLYILVFLVGVQVCFSGYGIYQRHLMLLRNSGGNVNPVNGVAPLKSIPDLPPTSIAFDTLRYDFGIIPDNKKVYTKFKFKNTGKEPLLIVSAEASCGCTIPSWPKEPIAPGKESFVEISFDPSGKLGEQSKLITLQSNAVPNTSILTIKATIIQSN
jgi:hypothetical protein